MSPTRTKTTRPYLSAQAVVGWNMLLDEVRFCLRDDSRSRLRINDLVDGVQARNAAWPTTYDGDELLLGGFLRLVLSFGRATAARRSWLGGVLALLIEQVEGMVDDFTSDDDAHVRPCPPALAPKFPRPLPGVTAKRPGERGYRADVDG